MFGYVECEPITYGGLEVSQAVKTFVKVPPKLRTFGGVNILDIDIECEALAAKQRWGAREVDKHPGITTEPLRLNRDIDFDKRQIVNGERIKFANQRPTDMRFNKCLDLPDPIDEDQKAQILHQKHSTKKIAQQYIKDHCNQRGVIKGSTNLTDEELKGRAEVKQGIKEKGWILYSTDKSGKMCFDSLENYRLAMQTHVAGDQEVQYSQVASAEKVLNNHSRVWAKKLGVGWRGITRRNAKIL